LTLPCDVRGAERALVVVRGPPDALDRTGIERGRGWLASETGSVAVRGGDSPAPSSATLSAVVLLSGVDPGPRVDELRRVALQAREALADRPSASDSDPEQLVSEGAEELSPLY
jgi:cell division GTPase FtsZ